MLKVEIGRVLDRLELLMRQLADVEAAREALVLAAGEAGATPARLLLQLRGIGWEFASVLWLEGLFRHFDNRRQLAAFSGLAPSPWRSGKVDHEQGISKSGNPNLRTTMIELAWMWRRHQPNSSLSRWFHDRVRGDKTKRGRKITIVAMARKLLIALWRFVTTGELPEGAELKPA
jgi:transposase